MPPTPSIQGQVRTPDGRPLSAVSVSNGHQVVPTDAQGRYALPRAAAQRFVFISTPAGYRPQAHFYQPLGDADFTLQPHPPSAADPFTFAQITDMHIALSRRAFGHHLQEDLARILDRARPHFFIASGDLTGGGTPGEYRAYRQATATVSPPFFHAAGNHDDDAESAGQNFQDHLGPLYYSFNWGPVHFVVYDGESDQRGRPDRQRAWLHADLALQPTGKPVILVNHFPWGRSFYNQWSAFNLVATLSGHWHSTRLHRDGDTTHYNTPSLGFGGIDQSPRGYRLFTWRADQLHSQIHTLADPGVFSGLTFRPPAYNRAGHKTLGIRLPDPPTDWPQLHGGPGRTGYTPEGPRPPLVPAWRAGTGGAIHLAGPALAEGLVVQPVKNEDTPAGNALVALEATSGAQRWRHPTNAALKNTPAYSQGRFFAATVTGQLLALDASQGAVQWSYQLGDPSQRWLYSSPLAADGRLYAGVSEHLVALDQATGQVLWKRTDLGIGDWLSSYPSPAAWGLYLVVAFYTQATNLAVLEAATGRTVWTQQGGKSHHIYSTPVVGPKGTLYAVSGGTVRAFALETGVVQWESPVPLQRIQATPALAQNRLFVATGSGALHALDAATGAELWQWDAGAGPPLFTPYLRQGRPTLTSPVVAGDALYIGTSNGTLHALDPSTGTALWQHDLGVPLAAPPALSENSLWVGTCDGMVHAFTEK